MYRNKQNSEHTTYISLCIKKFRSRLRNGCQFHTFREDDTDYDLSQQL